MAFNHVGPGRCLKIHAYTRSVLSFFESHSAGSPTSSGGTPVLFGVHDTNFK